MHTVSQAWKDAHRGLLVPESFVEIAINVGDPEAQAAASASDNGHEVFSDTPTIVDETTKEPVRYGTLEPNLWLLDGLSAVVPDGPPYGANGYVGDVLSGTDGNFTDPVPTITIDFGEVFDTVLPGLTITWGSAYEDEWATRYRVTAYNGETVVFQETMENDSLQSLFSHDITGYDKMTLEVLSWSRPGRRARIEALTVGVERVYDKSNLISYTHSMVVDPLSAELPTAEISFEIANLNGEYNPDNPQGAAKYLIDRQSLTVRYGYKLNGEVEWIKAGTFYLNGWDTPQNGITASFTARDGIEYMSEKYEGPTAGTLFDIATAAFEQSDMPTMADGSNRWLIDERLKEVSVPEELDMEGYSMAEVVQLAANAGCCVFYQDREGRFHIEPLAAGETDYPIDRFVSYSNAEISLNKPLKAVNVNDGAAVVTVGQTGEVKTINNPLITEDRAETVGNWAANYLLNRQVLSGSYRADPRLDPLDRVHQKNQFAEKVVLITEVSYTYNGAFRGSYTGVANA